MDRFLAWFVAHGGCFHSSVVLDDRGPFGVSVLAPKFGADTAVVTCPSGLIVTKHTSLVALSALLGPDLLAAWSARQLICAYLCFHHLCPQQSSVLRHLPYIQRLPTAASVLTPLQFTAAERDVLRGTNLLGATLERERDLRADWAQCQSLVQTINPAWADAFTWDMYLTASFHLSSRAFPSTILSPTPSLVSTPSTHPVLIPGVDLLNHKRGQPVSWIVSLQDGPDTTTFDAVSIVAHPTPDAEPETASSLIEVFNNYGLKSNGELILGYGFSLPDNPDDTITLQVGGSATSQKWVIGRHAENMDGLWSEVRGMIANGECDHEFEDDLDTAAVLSDMVQAKLDGMKTVHQVRQNDNVRPPVRIMLEHYIAGQREILESILEFLDKKRQAAIESATEQGIDLVFDDDDG